MTRLGRITPMLPMLPMFLVLSACQVAKGTDGMYHTVAGTSVMNGQGFSTGRVSVAQMRTSYPLILGLNFTTDKDARTVAAQLVDAHNAGDGMKSVALDVQRCYAAADADWSRNSGWPSEYRFCVLYDAVAYRLDTARVRRGLPRTAYFEPQLADNRWQQHILQAGQGRQSELDAFMTKGAAMVGPYLPSQLLGTGGSALSELRLFSLIVGLSHSRAAAKHSTPLKDEAVFS